MLGYFVRREMVWRTTWLTRVLVVGIPGGVLLILIQIAPEWLVAGLVHEPRLGAPEVLIIENLEPNYLLFEEAELLRRAGGVRFVLVPVFSDRNGNPGRVKLGMAELMAEVAHLSDFEVVTVDEREPISLNVAQQLVGPVATRGTRSLTVVTEGFRSTRTCQVYRRAFEGTRVSVECHPVFGSKSPENWATSWHGIQEVGLQFLKLWYYRLFVLWRVEPVGVVNR